MSFQVRIPELNLILIKHLGSCVIFNLKNILNKTQAVKLRTIRLLSAFLVLVIVQGCAIQPKSTDVVSNVNQIDNWQARGQLMIKSSKDKMSGYFYWHQYNQEDFKLVITSFIGTNVLNMEQKDGLTVLKIDGKTYNGTSPERLIERLTGNYIPVSHLTKWMLAEAPAESEAKFEQEKLKSFNYADQLNTKWQVNYKSYQAVSNVSLPKSMTVKGLDSTIKLNINNWELFTQ